MSLGTNVFEISSEGEGGGEEMDSECGQSLKRPLDSSSASAADDCEVIIIEKPPDLFQPVRKKGKTVKNNGSMNDECYILDYNPEEIVAVSETIGNDSEELAVTAERGHVACRDYPHSRHCCVSFPFNGTPHEKHCALCHCYVCDKPAPCLNWGQGNSTSDHCHASDEEKWRKLRSLYKLNKTQSVLQPIVDIIPPLSGGRSTVLASRSNQQCEDAVAYIPSNISQSASSQFRTPSFTDPASPRGPFSSMSLSSHLTGQSRGLLPSSMRSIGPAGRSNSIDRKAVTSASLISSHGGVNQFRSCSSTEHLSTDFQYAINDNSTRVHTSSRGSSFSTSNQNITPETRPASMYNLYSCMSGQFAGISQSGSIQTNSLSPTGQLGRCNPVGRREVASASLNINHAGTFQSGHCSSTNNLDPIFETSLLSPYRLHGYLPRHDANIGQSGSMHGVSTSSPGQTDRRNQMCKEPVTFVLSNISHVSGHQSMPCSFENNLNPAFQLGMFPTFGLQAHFPGQIECTGQSGTKLASSMNSTVQVGSSKQVGPIASVPTDISQSYAHQMKPSPFTNKLDLASWTQPLSALDLSSYLLLQNARIGQGQGTLANSMISTCQVGRSDQVGTETIACIPWNSGHNCVDQFRPSSFTNNLNPPPQTQPTNQFRSSSFTNNLKLNPPAQSQPANQLGPSLSTDNLQLNPLSQTLPPFSFDLSSHMHGQTEIRIASSTSPMDEVGTSREASIMSTRFNGTKICSLESNSMETTEPSNMLSSNNEQTTLETCSATQKVNQSADEGDSVDALSRNATPIQNVMDEAQLNRLREFLLGSDFDDDLYIQDTLFTDTFMNCLDQYSHSEVQPMIQASSQQLLSSCDSSTHVLQVASNIHMSGGVSNVLTLSNSVQFPAVEQMPATSTVLSTATD